MKTYTTLSSIWTINEDDKEFSRYPLVATEAGMNHPEVPYDLEWHPYSSYDVEEFMNYTRLVFKDSYGQPILPSTHKVSGVSGMLVEFLDKTGNMS